MQLNLALCKCNTVGKKYMLIGLVYSSTKLSYTVSE